jgi:4-hydroxy-tetrahydrodipicolinate reductase
MNKLKIALIGYGKMGKTIESLAIKKNHDIILKTSSSNPLEKNLAVLPDVDVAIEFTSPEIVAANLEILATNRVNTVCGSTGWLDDYDRLTELFSNQGAAFLYASNFSVGVNIFFALNRQLAKMMNNWPEYSVSLEESHHIQKKDAPSGTAVTLANQIIEASQQYKSWTLGAVDDTDSIDIKAHREGDVKGMHTVKYKSDIDQIEIKHEAFSREGFAMGALMAAEWLQEKKGIYSMRDVIGI